MEKKKNMENYDAAITQCTECAAVDRVDTLVRVPIRRLRDGITWSFELFESFE